MAYFGHQNEFCLCSPGLVGSLAPAKSVNRKRNHLGKLNQRKHWLTEIRCGMDLQLVRIEHNSMRWLRYGEMNGHFA